MRNKKILYFEGAGWDGANAEYNGLNCRIRTAFHDNNGKMIFVEIHGHHPNDYMLKEAKKEKKQLPTTYLYVDSAFYITDDPTEDDENKNRIKMPDYKAHINISYTLENIRDFINEHFNSSFTEVVILNDLAGYRVFSKDIYKNTSESYNFGDCFEYNAELTEKRIVKVEEMKKYFAKLFNQKYDNTSYYIEDNQLMVCINVTEEKRIAAGYKERKFVVEV